MKMEENEKKKKKKKKIVKKAKKIRGIVMMTLLCVLMMSAATYAWFTLSNTAKIANLTMTVGDVTGLQVADVNTSSPEVEPQEGDWGAETTAVTFKGKLLPATTIDGINIYEPVYKDDGSVGSLSENPTTKKLDASVTEDTTTGYYVEYSFWIRALGPNGETTTVKLDEGSDTNGGIYNAVTPASGTYSLSSALGESDILPSAAVRLSLINNSDVKVFEPNGNFNTGATKVADDNRTNKDAKKSDVVQNVEGTFSTANSDVLTLNNNQPTKILVKIWIEGTDKQCGNEIAAKDIITQLKFVTAE